MDGYHGHSDGLPESFSNDLQTALIAPIISAEKCLGVLSLFSMKNTKKFNNFDLMLVESLGRQAGLAIENAQLYFEVQMLTTSDPLTGLTNQLSFNNQGMKEVERSFRYNRPLGVVIVDIDNQSGIVENYGAEVGDAVIKSVAHNCGRSLRRVDILSRYTRDEFVLLLPETTLANTHEVAERLRQNVQKTKIELGKKTITATVSVGITSLENREEVDLETLLVRAEQALTDAKLAGGNQVFTWKVED
jgi:diguanylate cyclase (GGDEF)-like protein